MAAMAKATLDCTSIRIITITVSPMQAKNTAAAPDMTPATPSTAGSTPSSEEIRLVGEGPRGALPHMGDLSAEWGCYSTLTRVAP